MKNYLAIACTISAIIIGFIALFIPPHGVIDSSVLWFTAQMLLFVSAMLGVDLHLPYGSTSKKGGDE